MKLIFLLLSAPLASSLVVDKPLPQIQRSSHALNFQAHERLHSPIMKAVVSNYGGDPSSGSRAIRPSDATYSEYAGKHNRTADADGTIWVKPHGKNLTWLRALMPVDEVGTQNSPKEVKYPRAVSESGPWLEWIIDNYDKPNFPNYVAFLHGHQSSWHVHYNGKNIANLVNARPKFVKMMNRYICRAFSQISSSHEKFMLEDFFQTVHGISWSDAYDKFGLISNQCCSENVASEAAIKRHPKKLYELLLARIKLHRGSRWGWVYERLWQPLFQYDSPFSVDEIEENMANRLLTVKQNMWLVLPDLVASPWGDERYELKADSSIKTAVTAEGLLFNTALFRKCPPKNEKNDAEYDPQHPEVVDGMINASIPEMYQIKPRDKRTFGARPAYTDLNM